MRPNDIELAKEVENKLLLFSDKEKPLKGIKAAAARKCFVEQIVDSVRRVKYCLLIANQDVSPVNINVNSSLFDPLKGAVWFKRKGELDEAFWLVFLSTHFGKNLKTGWRLTRDTYSGLTDSIYWNWKTISNNNIGVFREWLEDNQPSLKTNGKFGNHRKYENLSGTKSRGTGAAFQSYVEWIKSYGSHEELLTDFITHYGDDPRILFRKLYHSMSNVKTFGRTAKFDFLSMIGKIGLAPVEPDSTYMKGATGPKLGAKLLFANNKNIGMKVKELEELLTLLESYLKLPFGMQILEDSLCNWQKNPTTFIHFRG